jgi:hypothetical protein
MRVYTTQIPKKLSSMSDLPVKLQKALIDGRKDPVIFIEDLLGMRLHEGQINYLRTTQRLQTRINVLTCANRWGKSTLLACLHIWYNFYKIGIPVPENDQQHSAWEKQEYRTSNIAPHSALTEPVFKTITQIMTSSFPVKDKNGNMAPNDCLIGWFFLPDRTLNTPPYKQFFDNNSYIEHRSLGADQGDSLQGKPYGLITYDEGFRSDHLQNEIDDAILPRLADWRGPLHILSTPSQSSHSTLYAYHLYQDGLIGRNQTYTQSGSLKENTFFTPSQIEAQYELYADNPLAEQVLEGKFIFGGDTLFPFDQIERSMTSDLNDGVRYIDGHTYTMGIDTAIGKDEMVYSVLDTTQKPWSLVWMDACKGNSRSPQMHLNALCNLVDNYKNGSNLEILLETWNGESARFYHDLPPYIKTITQCYGAWQPAKQRTDNDNRETTKTRLIKKADLLVALQKAFADNNLRLPKSNIRLLEQLQIYREEDKGIATDRVISVALAVWLAQDNSKVRVPVWNSIEI